MGINYFLNFWRNLKFWGLEIFASGADQLDEVFGIFGIFRKLKGVASFRRILANFGNTRISDLGRGFGQGEKYLYILLTFEKITYEIYSHLV